MTVTSACAPIVKAAAANPSNAVIVRRMFAFSF
jgi:hypothetical protein